MLVLKFATMLLESTALMFKLLLLLLLLFTLLLTLRTRVRIPAAKAAKSRAFPVHRARNSYKAEPSLYTGSGTVTQSRAFPVQCT